MPGVFLLPSAFASDLDHTGREVGHGGTRMTRMVSAGFQGKNYSKTQGFHPSNLGLPMNFQSKPALQLSFSSENGVPGYPQFPKDYNGFIYIYIIFIYIYTHTYIYKYILPFPIELFDMAISGIPNLWQQQTHIADDIPVYLHDTPTTGFIPHSIGTTSSF